MALVLGVKIGDVVDIAGGWLAVLSIDSSKSATVICDDGKKISLFRSQMTEFTPDVWIGLGRDAPAYPLRLLFDAPRHIPISRRRDHGR